MKHLFLSFACAAAVTAAGVEPLLVKNVSASVERGSHLVRITYDLSNEADEPAYVTLDAQTNGVSIGWDKFRHLSGDVTRLDAPKAVACGTGRSLAWNAPVDWPGQRVEDVTFRVRAHYTNAIMRIPGVYMKIDISDGPEADSYPVSYGFAGPDMTDASAYAKDTLWFRCIGPGAFQMGAQPGEPGINASGKEYQHTVTLTKPFYIGVLEVTEYQYRQVMGSIPVPGSTDAKGDLYPVVRCSYNILRGTTYSWPASSQVDADTFIGTLRAKTGLDGLDLPTEAQWEYACRAGTATSLYNGHVASDNSDAWLQAIAWLRSNASGGIQPVGGRAPNGWGLYDMLGNAYELVLDWFADDIRAYTLDPAGPATGTTRILRGGSAGPVDWTWIRAAWRLSWNPAATHQTLSARLALTLD